MKFDFTKNIYLYKGKCDLYVFGDEAGFERVVDLETEARRYKYYKCSCDYIKNDVRKAILGDFECGWTDCTKVISKDVSFSWMRID